MILFLSAVYLACGWVGRHLVLGHASTTAVWLTSGIALAALLLLGYRVCPAILLGAFVLNLPLAGSLAAAAGIAIGDTLEALVGAYLVQRFAGGPNAFHRARSVFRFALIAGILSPMLSATLGITSLSFAGLASRSGFGPSWILWWLNHAVGNLVVAPSLLLWMTLPLPRWDRRKITEGLAFGLYLLLASLGIFGDILPFPMMRYPLELLCIPFLVWAALRFGQQEAALSIVIFSAVASWGTAHGYGPFAPFHPDDSLLILLAFLGASGLMTHAVAVVVAERHQAEQSLREARDELAELAISDPLTGLANYRRFVDVFDAEAERSQRTRRSFALVLFDLDDLKQINDSHGHLTGTRALCRVGNTMRVYCRAIDTAIRYGGDEFALMLPETRSEEAHQVARRIATQVAGDGGDPPISVSFGVGEYPQDGRTMEEVFGKADAALYRMKRRKQPRQSTHSGG